MPDLHTVSRRKFLKQSVQMILLLGSIEGIISLSSCITPRYVDYKRQNGRLTVRKSAFGKNSYVLLDTEQREAPIFLKKQEEEQYKALSLLCRHKGCTVKPAGSILVCPCHGSEYTQQGKVLSGPTVKNLTEFPTEQDDKNVYIKITN